jgi:hypothetical protein
LSGEFAEVGDMILARVHNGSLEPQEPLPAEWEGQSVKIVPLTPYDPMPDWQDALARLEALGPVELDADERATMEMLLAEQDRLGREEMLDIGKGRKK